MTPVACDRFDELLGARRGAAGSSASDRRDLVRLEGEPAGRALVADTLIHEPEVWQEFWPSEQVAQAPLASAFEALDLADLTGIYDELAVAVSEHLPGSDGQQLAAIAVHAAVAALLVEGVLGAGEFAHLTSGARELLPSSAAWTGR